METNIPLRLPKTSHTSAAAKMGRWYLLLAASVTVLVQGCASYDSRVKALDRDYQAGKITSAEYDQKQAEAWQTHQNREAFGMALAAGLGGGGSAMNDQNNFANQPHPQTQTLRPAQTYTPSQVIETRIEGDFEGWTGETIWKMDNYQIWQQAAYAYNYHYAYRPKVIIYPVDGGWKMKVEGSSAEVRVKRLN